MVSVRYGPEGFTPIWARVSFRGPRAWRMSLAGHEVCFFQAAQIKISLFYVNMTWHTGMKATTLPGATYARQFRQMHIRCVLWHDSAAVGYLERRS
jgi:hypothetical protein